MIFKHDLSVIMTTYKENLNFLKTCIGSVLKQTYKDYEFIIVVEPDDDNIFFLNDMASIDRRVKILKNNSRLGVAGSRNRAILESSGKYIAIVDGDDYYDLNRFEKQLKFFKSNADVSLVGSNMFLIDENDTIVGERRYPELHQDIKIDFLLSNAIGNPTVMVRKLGLEDVGLFDSQLTKCEDFELWLKFLANNKRMYNLQEKLVYYRIPSWHNEKRGRLNWRNNYIARKKYSKFIWPLHKRIVSLVFYFFISQIPNGVLDKLLKFKIVRKIKKVK